MTQTNMQDSVTPMAGSRKISRPTSLTKYLCAALDIHAGALGKCVQGFMGMLLTILCVIINTNPLLLNK